MMEKMMKKMKTQATMDMFLMRTPGRSNSSDNQQNRPSQLIDPDAKKEPHKKRTFQYRFQGIQQTRVTCDRSATILDALQTSKKFRDRMKNNKGKEIVIERGRGQRAAFNTQSPCHLIDDQELLSISFIRAAKKDSSSTNKAPHNKSRKLSDQLITFNVDTRGGKKIQNKVMINLSLMRKVSQVCVSAYKGEKVRQALKRDGRFAKTIFTKGCELSEPAIDVTTEMSSYVDDLDGKSFQVKQVCRLNQPDSLEFNDNYENQLSPLITPQTSTTPEPGESKSPSKEETPGLAKQKWCDIQNSNEILNILRSQFPALFQHMKTRGNLRNSADVKRFIREEFGKKAKGCLEVRTACILLEHSKSVCQVRIDGKPMGTGFLLFDKFVLTNGHVVKSVYDQDTRQLQNSVTVTFDFLALDRSSEEIPVKKEVVAYEYNNNVMRCFPDMALLELAPDSSDPVSSLPPGLLSDFRFPCAEDAICIIGHPDGGVKKIDPCIIIKPEDRAEAAQSHVNENQNYMHVISDLYFMEQRDIDECLKGDNKRITYNSCFFHGASGSPVFDEHSKLIAMHTGGYIYKGNKAKTQSIIEYAIPLSLTLESVIMQIVLMKRCDVLKTFLIQGKNSNIDRVLKTVREILGKGDSWFIELVEDSINTQQSQQGEEVFSERGEAMDVE